MNECPTRERRWSEILAADVDPLVRRAALEHVLGGCAECDQHLDAADAELDSMISEACVRDLPRDEHEPLTPEERDAIFAAVTGQAPPMPVAPPASADIAAAKAPRIESNDPRTEITAGSSPTWPEFGSDPSLPDDGRLGRTLSRPEIDSTPANPGWRYVLTATLSLAAIVGAIVVLFMLMPSFHPSALDGEQDQSDAPSTVRAGLTLHIGSHDDEGQPLVGEAVADGAEVNAGEVLLFRVNTSCVGYPYLVVERENRAPDVIWHWETGDLKPGEGTLQSQGMPIGLNTFGETGKLVLHLLIEPEHRSLYTARSLLETAMEPHPARECWAHDSVTVHLRRNSAP